jgi:hypothetical protein
MNIIGIFILMKSGYIVHGLVMVTLKGGMDDGLYNLPANS